MKAIVARFPTRMARENIAKKYCFRATVKVLDRYKTPVAVIFSYDIKPSISSDLEKLAEEYCQQNADQEYMYDESELVIHEECPVELTGDIHFQIIRSDAPDPIHDGMAATDPGYDGSGESDDETPT